MKPVALGVLAAAALAACGPGPAPQASAQAAAQKALQPVLEPPLQVTVIPTPEPVAQAKPAAVRAPDDENQALAERVKRALEEDSPMEAAAIDVTAKAGTVTLWGTAASDDERVRATRVAARIRGVKWVDNKLAIASGS